MRKTITVYESDYLDFIKGFNEHPEVLKLYDLNQKQLNILENKIKRIDRKSVV